MKKLNNIIYAIGVAILLMACGSTKKVSDSNVQETLDQRYNRARLENIDAKIKELKEQGWEIDDSFRTMEFAYREYEKVNRNGNTSFPITIDLCDLEDCLADALTQAQRFYAQKSVAKVAGGIAGSRDKINNKTTKTILDKYNIAFESSVGGILEESLKLKKKNGGAYTYQVIFICNDEKSLNLRLENMKEALKGIELSEEMFKKIIGLTKVNPLR